jgi:hypothetical protein
LAAKRGRKQDAGFFEQVEHAIIKPRCLLPDRELFKLGVFGHALVLLSIGFCRLVIGYRCLAADYRPLAIGYRPLAIGYRPLAIDYRPLAIGYRPLAIGYRPLAIFLLHLVLVDAIVSAEHRHNALLHFVPIVRVGWPVAKGGRAAIDRHVGAPKPLPPPEGRAGETRGAGSLRLRQSGRLSRSFSYAPVPMFLKSRKRGAMRMVL